MSRRRFTPGTGAALCPQGEGPGRTLPQLYLKGISTGEMQSALEVLVGAGAKGLSASTVVRLKQVWVQEYQA